MAPKGKPSKGKGGGRKPAASKPWLDRQWDSLRARFSKRSKSTRRTTKKPARKAGAKRPAAATSWSKRWQATQKGAAKRWKAARKSLGQDLKTARARLANVWKHDRPWAIGGAAVIALVMVFAGYSFIKRPADISNPNAVFTGEIAQPIIGVADWPLYGLNEERDRYMNAPDVKPPYAIKWKFKGNRLLEYSPILIEGSLYAVNNNGRAYAIKTRSGKARWKAEIATRNASSPAYDPGPEGTGVLFVSNLEPGQVQALDARGGEQLWVHKLPGRSESSPVVVDDKVIVGCECGTLYAFDKATGNTIWETDLGGQIKAAPAVSDGIVYVGNYSGDFKAVNADTGDIKWEAGSQGGSFGQAGAFYGTAAVAFGRVYAASKDGRVYSFEKDSGDVAWSHTAGGELYAGIVAADTPDTDPTVYLGGYGDSRFYALDAKSGDERWSIDAGGPVIGAASLVNETVYFANLKTTETIGVTAKDGEEVFKFPDGAYNPVISDGKQLYLTGYKTIYGLAPTSGDAENGVVGKPTPPTGTTPSP